MVNFTNKTVILRLISSGFFGKNGNASGIVKYKSGNTCEISVATLNFERKENGDYYLIFCDEDHNMKIFPLENPPLKQDFDFEEKFNCKSGFASLIIFSENNKITPIAFGTTLKDTIKISSFTRFFEREISYEKDVVKQDLISENEGNNKIKNEDKEEIKLLNNYDDEALADENYFENYNFSSDDKVKLTKRETIDENIENFRKNFSLKENENEQLHRENAHSEKELKLEFEEEKINGNFEDYENSADTCTGKTNCFYQNIEEKLLYIFKKYPNYEGLSNVIPESKWAKIPFGNDKFYIVGIAKEMDKPMYIIYGVPGISDFKPKGFEKYSVFLPENMFEITNKGYWCIFQSAIDGNLKC